MYGYEYRARLSAPLRRRVAVVDGNAAGRTGIVALLASLPDCLLMLDVGSTEAFWRVPARQLWLLDEVLVHAASLSGAPQSGRIFIRQVRLMLPGVKVRVLSAGVGWTDGADGVVDYGASLSALRHVMNSGGWRTRGAVSPLTEGEWRVLAGAMSGVPVITLAKLTGRSVKTLYAQRNRGLKRLGVSRLPALLTEVPSRYKGPELSGGYGAEDG